MRLWPQTRRMCESRKLAQAFIPPGGPPLSSQIRAALCVCVLRGGCVYGGSVCVCSRLSCYVFAVFSRSFSWWMMIFSSGPEDGFVMCAVKNAGFFAIFRAFKAFWDRGSVVERTCLMKLWLSFLWFVCGRRIVVCLIMMRLDCVRWRSFRKGFRIGTCDTLGNHRIFLGRYMNRAF